MKEVMITIYDEVIEGDTLADCLLKALKRDYERYTTNHRRPEETGEPTDN